MTDPTAPPVLSPLLTMTEDELRGEGFDTPYARIVGLLVEVEAQRAEGARLKAEKEALIERLTDDRLRAMFKAVCEAGNEAFNHYQHQDYNDAECRAACDEAECETLKAEILTALGLSDECPTCGRSLKGSFPLCIDCQLVEALKKGDAP